MTFWKDLGKGVTSGSFLGSAVGGVFNAVGSRKQFKRQRRLQREQNQFNLDMWNLNNEYNDPSAQRDRLIGAGFSPYLMQGAPQNISSAPPASADTPEVPNYGEIFANTVNSIVNQFIDAKKWEDMKDIKEKELGIKKEGVEGENKFKGEESDRRNKALETDLEYTKAKTDLAKAQKDLSKKTVDHIDKQMSKLDKDISHIDFMENKYYPEVINSIQAAAKCSEEKAKLYARELLSFWIKDKIGISQYQLNNANVEAARNKTYISYQDYESRDNKDNQFAPLEYINLQLRNQMLEFSLRSGMDKHKIEMMFAEFDKLMATTKGVADTLNAWADFARKMELK